MSMFNVVFVLYIAVCLMRDNVLKHYILKSVVLFLVYLFKYSNLFPKLSN